MRHSGRASESSTPRRCTAPRSGRSEPRSTATAAKRHWRRRSGRRACGRVAASTRRSSASSAGSTSNRCTTSSPGRSIFAGSGGEGRGQDQSHRRHPLERGLVRRARAGAADGPVRCRPAPAEPRRARSRASPPAARNGARRRRDRHAPVRRDRRAVAPARTRPRGPRAAPDLRDRDLGSGTPRSGCCRTRESTSRYPRRPVRSARSRTLLPESRPGSARTSAPTSSASGPSPPKEPHDAISCRARMRIGVAKEIKSQEYRVALTPAGARELVQARSPGRRRDGRRRRQRFPGRRVRPRRRDDRVGRRRLVDAPTSS